MRMLMSILIFLCKFRGERSQCFYQDLICLLFNKADHLILRCRD